MWNIQSSITHEQSTLKESTCFFSFHKFCATMENYLCVWTPTNWILYLVQCTRVGSKKIFYSWKNSFFSYSFIENMIKFIHFFFLSSFEQLCFVYFKCNRIKIKNVTEWFNISIMGTIKYYSVFLWRKKRFLHFCLKIGIEFYYSITFLYHLIF